MNKPKLNIRFLPDQKFVNDNGVFDLDAAELYCSNDCKNPLAKRLVRKI